MSIGLKIEKNTGDIVDENGSVSVSKLIKCGCVTLKDDTNDNIGVTDKREIVDIINSGIINVTDSPELQGLPSSIINGKSVMVIISNYNSEYVYNFNVTNANIDYIPGTNYFTYIANTTNVDIDSVLNIWTTKNGVVTSNIGTHNIGILVTPHNDDQMIIYNRSNIRSEFLNRTNMYTDNNKLEPINNGQHIGIPKSIIQGNGYGSDEFFINVNNKICDIPNNAHPDILDNSIQNTVNRIHYTNINGRELSIGDIISNENNDKATIGKITIDFVSDIKKVIEVYYSGTIMLMNDGTVYGYGNNLHGAFGIGTYDNETPEEFIKLPIDDVKNIYTGNGTLLILKNNGEVWGAGNNGHGKLGTTKSYVTTMYNTGITDAVSISVSDFNSAVVTADGSLYVVGVNNHGQLTDGTTDDSSTFILSPVTNVASVSLGIFHIAIVTKDGNLHTAGINVDGQLGNGNFDDVSGSIIDHGLNNVTNISCGSYSTAYVSSSGEIYYTGNNYNMDKKNSFTLLDLPNGVTCTEISSYYNTTVIIGSDNYAYGIGDVYNETTSNFIKLLSRNISAISASYKTIFYKDMDYTGIYYNGTSQSDAASEQINDDFNAGLKSLPMYESRHPVIILENPFQTTPTKLFDIKDFDIYPAKFDTNVIDNSTTSSINKIYIDRDIYIPEIGDKLITDYGVNFSVVSTDRLITDTVTNTTLVSVTDDATCIVTPDGSVFVIGSNEYGKLGVDSSETLINSWTKININDVKSVIIKNKHSLILKNDGTIWGCGDNGNIGRYGLVSSNGDTISGAYTMKLVNQDLFEAKDICASAYNSYAIDIDGNLWFTGDNTNGQLGTGDTTNIPTWTKSTMNDVISISAHDYTTAIVKSDGTVWFTGINNVNFGIDSSSNSITWVQSDISDAKEISINMYSSVVLKNDGTVWVTGDNSNGRIGESTDNVYEVWVQSDMNDVKSISAAYSLTTVLKNNGEAWGVGRNINGILGLGSMYSTYDWVKLSDRKFTSIATNDNRVCLIDMNGDVYGIGNNSSNSSVTELTKIPNISGKLAIILDYTTITPDKILPLEPYSVKLLEKIDEQNASLLHSDILSHIDYTSSINNTNIMDNDAVQRIDKLYYNQALYTPEIGDVNKINNDIKVTVNSYGIENYVIEKIIHNFFITNNGDLFACGNNDLESLGTFELGDAFIYTDSVIHNVINFDNNVTSSIALTENGDVYVVGDNWFGCFGIGVDHTTTDDCRSGSWIKSNISDIKDIACRDMTNIALTNDGRVLIAGRDDFRYAYSDEMNFINWDDLGISDVSKIFIGPGLIFVSKNDGSTWLIGHDDNGTAGLDGGGQHIQDWTEISITNVVDASASLMQTLLLDSDGKVWGTGYIPGAGVQDQRTWIYSGIDNVVKLAGDRVSDHTLALKNDGTVWGLGVNNRSQLINLDLGGPNAYSDWVQLDTTGINPIDIAVYDDSSKILGDDGILYVRGSNGTGQLGTGEATDSVNVLTPAKNTFNNGKSYITIDETLSEYDSLPELPTVMHETLYKYYNNPSVPYSKKINTQYLLYTTNDVVIGDKLVTDYNEKITVTNYDSDRKLISLNEPLLYVPERLYWYNNYIPEDLEEPFRGIHKLSTIEETTDIVDHTLNTENTIDKLYINKLAYVPEIGDKLITENAEIFNIDNVSNGKYNFDRGDIKLFTGSKGNIFVVNENDELWCYGNNINGEFGTGNNVDSYDSWVKSDISDVKKVVYSNGNTYVIKNDGTAWGCGDNQFGQLGDGTTNDSFSFKRIGDKLYKDVATGYGACFLIAMDDELFALGNNNYGFLCTENTDTYVKTVTTVGLYVKKVVCLPSLAIITIDDEVYYSKYINSKITLIDSGLKGKKIASSYTNISVITLDNELYSIGDNTYGQLDNGNKVGTTDTFIKSSMSNVSGVYVGINSIMIIDTDGVYYSIGRNIYGELCTGDMVDHDTFTVIPNNNYLEIHMEQDITFIINKNMEIGIFGRERMNASNNNTSHDSFYNIPGVHCKNAFAITDYYVTTNTPIEKIPNNYYTLSEYSVNDVNIVPESVNYVSNLLNIRYNDVYINESYELNFKMVQNKNNIMTNFSGLIFK